jgi:hypothetical protein
MSLFHILPPGNQFCDLVGALHLYTFVESHQSRFPFTEAPSGFDNETISRDRRSSVVI